MFTRLNNQRGALFGLDARVAMVIFAALSVVAGYTAFGKINRAKDARLLKELYAIENALDSYQTDMGTFFIFTLDEDDDTKEDLSVLWDKTRIKQGFKRHWNGPYLNVGSTQSQLFGKWSLTYGQEEYDQYCSTSSRCFVWLNLTGVPKETWKKVNTFVDEANGKEPEGGDKIRLGRIQASHELDPLTLYYRTIERP